MGRTTVTTQGIKATDIKVHLNVPIQGIYMGKKVIQTKIGPNTVYMLKGKTKNVEIFGFTNLNHAMDSVSEGDTVTITYLGKQAGVKTKFGIKDVHQARVEKWDGQGEQFDLPEFGSAASQENTDEIPF